MEKFINLNIYLLESNKSVNYFPGIFKIRFMRHDYYAEIANLSQKNSNKKDYW